MHLSTPLAQLPRLALAPTSPGLTPCNKTKASRKSCAVVLAAVWWAARTGIRTHTAHHLVVFLQVTGEAAAGGMTEDQILADFPSLTQDDIRACLAFAAARERRLSSLRAA